MVMSELTGGVDGAGLLVFLGCLMKGRYIDPDQQGDNKRLKGVSVVVVVDGVYRKYIR
jgi:hypothetical protein